MYSIDCIMCHFNKLRLESIVNSLKYIALVITSELMCNIASQLSGV